MTETVSGSLVFREMNLPSGQAAQMHEHPFDHTVIVLKGRVRVTAVFMDHCWAEQELGPADRCLIEPLVRHEIVALEPSIAWCVLPLAKLTARGSPRLEDGLKFKTRPPSDGYGNPPVRNDARLAVFRGG